MIPNGIAVLVIGMWMMFLSFDQQAKVIIFSILAVLWFLGALNIVPINTIFRGQ